jgi:hypothetical protein
VPCVTGRTADRRALPTKNRMGVFVRYLVVKGFPSRITFQIISRHAGGDCCEEFLYVVLYVSSDIGDERLVVQIELQGNSPVYRLAQRPQSARQLHRGNSHTPYQWNLIWDYDPPLPPCRGIEEFLAEASAAFQREPPAD